MDLYFLRIKKFICTCTGKFIIEYLIIFIYSFYVKIPHSTQEQILRKRIGREKNIFNSRFTAKTRCTKTNTYPRAGHDGLSELWETICQAQYRPSPSLSNPCKLRIHSRCRRPSWGCVLQCRFTYTLPYKPFSAPCFHPLLPLFPFSPKSSTISRTTYLFFYRFGLSKTYSNVQHTYIFNNKIFNIIYMCVIFFNIKIHEQLLIYCIQ